jgi:hypothetical protein
LDASLLAESNKDEARAATRAAKKALKDAERAKLIFDAAVLSRMGQGGALVGGDAAQIAARVAEPPEQAMVSTFKPAHMPVLFPEVFLRDNGGFDVLIGNPPWEKLKVEEHQWWGLRFIGLRGMPMAERTKKVKELRKARPDLVVEYEKDVELSNSARKIIAAGPYPGIWSGDIDLYKAFAWRNWQLIRKQGRLGLVLPRGALNGSGTQKWRREILEHGTFENVVVGTNSRGWLFGTIHQQMTIGLIVAEKSNKKKTVAFAGSFHSRDEFNAGRDNLVIVDREEFLSWTGTASFPLLPDELAGEIFVQMRKSPAFSDATGFEFRPNSEIHATQDSDLFSTNLSKPIGEVPVLTGSSFNIWSPDFAEPYAYGTQKTINHILEKTMNSANQVRSAFNGLKIFSEQDLPLSSPRIAFRDVTNATNTRTMLCCLVPPGVVLVHKAPYLVKRKGDEKDEAFVLGVLSSRIFDWYARRLIELGMTFEMLMPMPIPRPAASDSTRLRVIEISGSLAAVDKRYAKWAKAVGVPVGSVKTDAEKGALIDELDALVAHLYGLSRSQLEHVFKTFHRGWDYSSRLTQVLAFYDQLPKVKS